MEQPNAIILAGEPLENDLSTIFGKRETASLMIGGTMLIEHTLRELQDLNFSQCIVLAKDNASEIHALVNGSKHWGMNIEVMNYTPSKTELLREFKSMSQPNGLLLIEANKLRSRSVAQFLKQCNQTDYPLHEATSSNSELGLTYLKPSNADLIITARPIKMPDVNVNSFLTTYDFHRANMDLITGKYAGLESSVSSHLIGPRLQHWSAKVDKRSNINQASVMIDRKCRIERNVSMDAVVLNHGVYVEKNVTLQNTIVMPNAVIPANQDIRNSIVDGDRIYSVF